MKNYRIEFKPWSIGSGFSCNSTIDNVSGFVSAIDYAESLDADELKSMGCGVIEVINDEINVCCSSCWINLV